MSVNYDIISESYDTVRDANAGIIDIFTGTQKLSVTSTVLDFGSGTGNHAISLQERTHADVYGVEPSDGMREKAEKKRSGVTFVKGNHEAIPFPDGFFDFVFMTDVIHHVPDIRTMFREIGRVLRPGAMLCIVTESHIQIENRFYVRYFPSTAVVDKKRYPDIAEIIAFSRDTPLTFRNTEIVGGGVRQISPRFIEIVRNKGYSMFHLIPEDEYREGLWQIEQDARRADCTFPSSGETMIWFCKR